MLERTPQKIIDGAHIRMNTEQRELEALRGYKLTKEEYQSLERLRIKHEYALKLLLANQNQYLTNKP